MTAYLVELITDLLETYELLIPVSAKTKLEEAVNEALASTRKAEFRGSSSQSDC